MQPRQTPSVPITESALHWRPVRVQTAGAHRIQDRLILVDLATGVAIDGDFGFQMRCRILSGFTTDQGRQEFRRRPGYDFIDIRVISRRQEIDRRRNRSKLVGPDFVPGPRSGQQWAQMVCSNDLDHVYFASGG